MTGYWVGFVVLIGAAGWSLWKATRPVPKDRPADSVTTVIGEPHLTRGPPRHADYGSDDTPLCAPWHKDGECPWYDHSAAWSTEQYKGCPVCLGSGEVSQMDEPAGLIACPECAHSDGLERGR